MPRLLLRSLPGTLVDEACRTAVARQIEYGRQKGVPWGISESAFNAQYVDGDYQYQAFGVPGLGLKRGLERDLVVAPYATAMAAMIAPREALENFRRLAEAGGEGAYGFYEAIDYTPDRVPKGQRVGRRPVVHGAPPGDEPGRPGQRRARRPDAPPVPRRADGPRRRPALAGARPPRRADRSSPSEVAAAPRTSRAGAVGRAAPEPPADHARRPPRRGRTCSRTRSTTSC